MNVEKKVIAIDVRLKPTEVRDLIVILGDEEVRKTYNREFCKEFAEKLNESIKDTDGF